MSLTSGKRPNFYNSILQAFLVLSILAFLLCTAWMFITRDACGVYVYGLLALYFLFSAVGFTLVKRWLKIGAPVIIVVNILAIGALEYIFFVPLNGSIDEWRNFMPLLTGLFVSAVSVLPLFIAKDKSSHDKLWDSMKGGAGIKHFRHIYQLTLIFTLGILAAMLFYKSEPTIREPVAQNADVQPAVVKKQKDISLLDSTKVSLNDVIALEGLIDSMPADLQLKYNRRIFALKHILLSGLMAEKHNTSNLINICKIHFEDYSPEQQTVLEWFVTLPEEEQALWMECPPVDNISSFEKEVKQRISDKQK